MGNKQMDRGAHLANIFWGTIGVCILIAIVVNWWEDGGHPGAQ
jgi:hypothetical protein